MPGKMVVILRFLVKTAFMRTQHIFTQGRKPCEGQNLEVLFSASRLSESRKLRGGESNDSQSSSSRGPRWMIHGKNSLSPSLLFCLLFHSTTSLIGYALDTQRVQIK